MSPPTIVSAPGKVLVAGGYLVLDPVYSGIVVSTSARFYTVAQSRGSAGHIHVRSPQFVEASWDYSVAYEPSIRVQELSTNTSKNKFVHLALQHTLSLISAIKGVSTVQKLLKSGLDIAIVGDNDFYSQRAKLADLGHPRTLKSLSLLDPLLLTGLKLSDVHKTGLGSSAALITSLVSALLLHFQAIESEAFDNVDNKDRRLAHNLAQYVHCLAQGKIGSGFDVAAAVFGSHLYSRFDPAVLQPLMAEETPSSHFLLSALKPSSAWNYKTERFQLPPLTRIMLADVDAGSDTPSLVGKVLKWRKDKDEEAKALWTALDQLNQSFAQTLMHISKLHDDDPATYTEAVKYISSLQSLQWMANPWSPEEEIPIISAFWEAHELSQTIRAKMREMGILAGVPIEPEEQTKLLDACVKQAGVIGGGVPGAGGYDAIWVLVCDPVDCTPDQHPWERIEHTWSQYKDMDVSPLSCTESTAKGIRLETIDGVKGLKTAIEQ